MICTKATLNLVHTCAAIAKYGKTERDSYGVPHTTLKLKNPIAGVTSVVYHHDSSGNLLTTYTEEGEHMTYTAADSLPLGLVRAIKETVEA